MDSFDEHLVDDDDVLRKVRGYREIKHFPSRYFTLEQYNIMVSGSGAPHHFHHLDLRALGLELALPLLISHTATSPQQTTVTPAHTKIREEIDALRHVVRLTKFQLAHGRPLSSDADSELRAARQKVLQPASPLRDAVHSEDWRDVLSELLGCYIVTVCMAASETEGSGRSTMVRERTAASFVAAKTEQLSLGAPYDEEIHLLGAMEACHILRQRASHVAVHEEDLGAAAQEIRFFHRFYVLPLEDELLKFDFRNGPLRRKFDSVKYVSKALEELLYQLSFRSSDGASREGLSGVPEDAPAWDLGEIRLTIEKYDAARDEIIKRARDITKAGKQAIYSCHRAAHEQTGGPAQRAAKELERAFALLRDGRKVAETLMRTFMQPRTVFEDAGDESSRVKEGTGTSAAPTILPGFEAADFVFASLRYQPSFSQALEELAEAALFANFFSKKKILLEDGSAGTGMAYSGAEVVGALSDFTGELHRWAVFEGTQRRRESLQLNSAIQTEVAELFLALGAPAGRAALQVGPQPIGRVAGKKGGSVRTNLSKGEQLLFESRLSELKRLGGAGGAGLDVGGEMFGDAGGGEE